MNRRDWLKQGSIALGGALLGWGLPGRWVDRDLLAEPQWSYTEATGPDHWAELDGAFQTCAIGRQQSPIDLQTLGGPVRRTLRLDYGPAGTRIRNTGRSIFVDCRTQACTIGFGGQLYNLMQFHFHHPSEHHLAGRSFPAEVQTIAPPNSQPANCSIASCNGLPKPWAVRSSSTNGSIPLTCWPRNRDRSTPTAAP
jgi:carbonic anhydrase